MMGVAMLRLLLLILVCSLPLRAEVVVRACGGEGEWIPSSYFKRVNGSRTAEVAGYSPDVLRAALRGSGYRVEFALLPWLRCQREVEQGQRFQLAMGMLHSPERARLYRFSDAYLRFQPGYFYLHRRYPQGLQIRQLDELSRYKVCGLYGYNYGFTRLRPEQMDNGALDYPAAMAKLAFGRCEILIETLEVMAGQRRLGRLSYDADLLRGRPLPETPPVVAHFAVSPQMADADTFLRVLNAGLARLQRERKLEAILRMHTSP